MNELKALVKSSYYFCLLSEDRWMIERIKNSLSPLENRLIVSKNENDLLQVIRTVQCALLVFDVRSASNEYASLLTWQQCHSNISIPLIVVGDFLSVDMIFSWYDAGARDVLCMPFNTDELHVRIALALRSSIGQPTQPSIATQLTLGDYRLDRISSTVYYNDARVRLTCSEFAIIWLLFNRPNVCVPRTHLSQAVWSRQTELSQRTIEQHIYKLRKKLFLDNQNRRMRISTVYSYGYKLEISHHLPQITQGLSAGHQHHAGLHISDCSSCY